MLPGCSRRGGHWRKRVESRPCTKLLFTPFPFFQTPSWGHIHPLSSAPASQDLTHHPTELVLLILIPFLSQPFLGMEPALIILIPFPSPITTYPKTELPCLCWDHTTAQPLVWGVSRRRGKAGTGLDSPSYSGKQMLRWTFLIFSSKRSFLLRKRMMEVAAKNLWLHILLNRCRDSCIRFCREADHQGLTPPLGHCSPAPSPHSREKSFSLFATAAAAPAACPVPPGHPKSQINPGRVARGSGPSCGCQK